MVLSLAKQSASENDFQRAVAESLGDIATITRLVADRAAFTATGRSLSREAIDAITGGLLANITDRKLSPIGIPAELDRLLRDRGL